MVILLGNLIHVTIEHEAKPLGEKVKVLQKGKITLPADIRQRFGIGEGDYIELQIIGNKVVLLPSNTVPNPTEFLSGLVKGISAKEPIKKELRKASAARIDRKMKRST